VGDKICSVLKSNPDSLLLDERENHFTKKVRWVKRFRLGSCVKTTSVKQTIFCSGKKFPTSSNPQNRSLELNILKEALAFVCRLKVVYLYEENVGI
jgi:ATPase components of ABC transporters with duplicated ATPase domains